MATEVTRETSVKRLQNQLNKRVDEQIELMINNYRQIVAHSSINDHTQLQIKIHVENLVEASEALLQTIHQLKQLIIVSDFTTMNEELNKKTRLFEKQRKENEDKLLTVSKQIDQALLQLEQEYYSSTYKLPIEKEQ